MNHLPEESNDRFKNAPRLGEGKNTCVQCGKDFILFERELDMPGTKDLESVFCPYCKAYNGEIFINGLAGTSKIEE